VYRPPADNHPCRRLPGLVRKLKFTSVVRSIRFK
jgi:hypothetical protein